MSFIVSFDRSFAHPYLTSLNFTSYGLRFVFAIYLFSTYFRFSSMETSCGVTHIAVEYRKTSMAQHQYRKETGERINHRRD